MPGHLLCYFQPAVLQVSCDPGRAEKCGSQALVLMGMPKNMGSPQELVNPLFSLSFWDWAVGARCGSAAWKVSRRHCSPASSTALRLIAVANRSTARPTRRAISFSSAAAGSVHSMSLTPAPASALPGRAGCFYHHAASASPRLGRRRAFLARSRAHRRLVCLAGRCHEARRSSPETAPVRRVVPPATGRSIHGRFGCVADRMAPSGRSHHSTSVVDFVAAQSQSGRNDRGCICRTGGTFNAVSTNCYTWIP